MTSHEPCPVCFTDDFSSLKPLRGCGHHVCIGCKNNLKKTNNQHIIKYDHSFVKCPICRAIEKPTFTQLEQHVERLEILNRSLQLNLTNKNKKILDLLCELRGVLLFQPPTVINLVDPATNPPRPNPPAPNRPQPLITIRNALNRCQRTGCRRKNRTRDRCRNHPDTPCCSGCFRRCNLCVIPRANPN